MPQAQLSPPLTPAESAQRRAAVLDLQDHQPFHKVAKRHGLEIYQLYLWAQEEGIYTSYGPPYLQAQMVLRMVDELGVKWTAQQLRLPEYEVRDLVKSFKWWKQPPNWPPGTKVTLGDRELTVITVYNGLLGKVLDHRGRVIDSFPWQQGRQRARSLGSNGFAGRAKLLESHEDPRGKRLRFFAIASAMRDLGCGMTVKAVAETYGRSEATISAWAKKRHVKVDWLRRYHGPLPTDWERAIMRVSGELGPTETSSKFGLTRQRVHQILRKYNEAGWREAPGWETGEKVSWGGNELVIAAVYDADTGAVWDCDGTLHDPVHWEADGCQCRSQWLADRTLKRRFKWKDQ